MYTITNKSLSTSLMRGPAKINGGCGQQFTPFFYTRKELNESITLFGRMCCGKNVTQWKAELDRSLDSGLLNKLISRPIIGVSPVFISLFE